MAIDIKWSPQFEVGHERIDHEHQIFLNLIKNVSLGAEENASLEWSRRLLREVKKYTEFHFVSEENIMFRVAYPEYDAHKQEHVTLLASLDSELHAFNAGKVDLQHIAGFLFEWFALHTTQSDKKLAKYIAERGEFA
jgi:hemerythrin